MVTQWKQVKIYRFSLNRAHPLSRRCSTHQDALSILARCTVNEILEVLIVVVRISIQLINNNKIEKYIKSQGLLHSRQIKVGFLPFLFTFSKKSRDSRVGKVAFKASSKFSNYILAGCGKKNLVVTGERIANRRITEFSLAGAGNSPE